MIICLTTINNSLFNENPDLDMRFSQSDCAGPLLAGISLTLTLTLSQRQYNPLKCQ
jgi:hypothetical protein